jgi:hypothetical protein
VPVGFLMPPQPNGDTLPGEGMSDAQSFERWLPFQNEPSNVVMDGLIDAGDDDFQLLLRSLDAPSERLLLRWPQRPLAYRSIDESFRLRLWKTFATGGYAFWIVQGSEWIRDFHVESYGVTEGQVLVHYAIFTNDDCVDVMSAVAPTAERMPLNPALYI